VPSGQYQRTPDMYASRRNSLAKIASTLEAKSERITETGCRIWNGRIGLNGYGVMIMDNKAIYAHRAAYLVHNGSLDDVPLIRHKCGVRCCTEPTHLAAGTHHDNAMDRIGHGTMPYGEKGSKAKLTESQAVSIIADSRGHAEIAAEYGVDKSQVSRIKSGKRWPHLKR
jgi:hypothetical protein